MKKYYFFLLFIFTITSYAQLTISMEDAYSFKRINTSYVLLQTAKTKTVYQADKNGVISLSNISGEIDLVFYANNYETLKAHFDISKPLAIKAILTPITGYIEDVVPSNTLIKGLITDNSTGLPIANATIDFTSFKTKNKANKKGVFYFNKSAIQQQFKEGDSIHYTVSATNYITKTISYRYNTVTCFTSIALEPINKPIVNDAITAQKMQDVIAISLVNTQARNTTLTCGNLPSSIRVGTACSCNTCSSVSVMDIEVYTRKGLNDEWIASWESESLKAGSLPYKSYGAYHVAHPIDANFDISSTTCRQVWDSDYASECIDACAVTAGLYMVTSTNAIAFTEYSAENNGLNAPAGESCGDGYAGNSTSSPCISDALCAGHDRFGHGRGMCQWGTQRWALNGKTYQWIADHYYNPVNIYRCDGSSTVALDCSNAVSLTCGTSYHGASSTATSNVGQYACNTWTETGPERVHTFTATGDGTFTVTLSNFSGDLDVYILGSCDPSDCIGTVASSSATYTNAVQGDTYYIVVDADDGSGSAYDIVVDCNALAVEELGMEETITITPNPSTGIFTIHNTRNTIKRIHLYNTLGQYIKTVNTTSIDLTLFPAGFYYLKIETTENKKLTLKVIKK